MALREWSRGTPRCTLEHIHGLYLQVQFSGLRWPRRGVQEVTAAFLGAADFCARTLMICPVCEPL